MKNNFIMKKVLFAVVLFVLSASVYAQKDVTRFLGIPIDGSKSEMIRKLKAKGFESSPYDKEVLTGEFNGTEVNVYVLTNNNKVFRIALEDVYVQDEHDIVARFNRLCHQFERNNKYVCYRDYAIPEDENIEYEMYVKNKRYEAGYYQRLADTTAMFNEIKDLVSEIANSGLESDATEEQRRNWAESVIEEMPMLKRLVWFRIEEDRGKYRIIMYYDNKFNMANGEDL